MDLAAYPLWIATYPTYANIDPETSLSTGIGPWWAATPTWTFQQYRSDPATQKTNTSTPPRTADTTVEPYVAGKCPGIAGFADLDSGLARGGWDCGGLGPGRRLVAVPLVVG